MPTCVNIQLNYKFQRAIRDTIIRKYKKTIKYLQRKYFKRIITNKKLQLNCLNLMLKLQTHDCLPVRPSVRTYVGLPKETYITNSCN